MIHSIRLFALAFGSLAVVIGGCGDGGLSPASSPLELGFVEHVDYGCTGTRDAELDCEGQAEVVGLVAASDTLALRIRFEANCCPGFTESASYENGLLLIEVADTLAACRCICLFENEFRFTFEGAGSFELAFRSRTEKGEGTCISGLDTTLTLPAPPGLTDASSSTIRR